MKYLLAVVFRTLAIIGCVALAVDISSKTTNWETGVLIIFIACLWTFADFCLSLSY